MPENSNSCMLKSVSAAVCDQYPFSVGEAMQKDIIQGILHHYLRLPLLSQIKICCSRFSNGMEWSLPVPSRRWSDRGSTSRLGNSQKHKGENSATPRSQGGRGRERKDCYEITIDWGI